MGYPNGSRLFTQDLAADLLGRSGNAVPPGLASGLLQGMPGIVPAPPMVSDEGQASMAAGPSSATLRTTDDNVDRLARVLTAECQHKCNAQETQGVGSTVINRMNRDGTNDVSDVVGRGAYAIADTANPTMVGMARGLLSGSIPDNTGGATHFYSPNSMPKAGADTQGWDIGGGLEQIPGHEAANYRPKFAAEYPENAVPNTDPWNVKFFTEPGAGRVN